VDNPLKLRFEFVQDEIRHNPNRTLNSGRVDIYFFLFAAYGGAFCTLRTQSFFKHTDSACSA
jgi:hypothetical protein